MDRKYKIAITSIAFIIIIFSIIVMMIYPKRGESSTTPLDFGIALIFLIVFWLAITFIISRQVNYRPYDWYTPSSICF